MPSEDTATVCPPPPEKRPDTDPAQNLLQKLSIEGLCALNSTRKSVWNEYVQWNENIVFADATKSPDAKKQKADLTSKLNGLSTDVAKGNAKFW